MSRMVESIRGLDKEIYFGSYALVQGLKLKENSSEIFWVLIDRAG